MKDKRILLSTLWIFAVLNYLYCDVLSFMDHSFLNELLTGKVGDIDMNEGFLLGASVLMEISISMVLLSRVLPYRSNRLANIVAGAITTSAQIASLFVGSATIHYVFFSVIEIATTTYIFLMAIKWKETKTD
ncbi:MAG: hypothetical protein KDC58_06225 [Cyclobacteriaceae bacterium]|nr:hypothetical protein [Cyclobacteriaceae bacterium]